MRKSGPIGIDVGLKSFLATSDGQFVDAPQFYRKAQSHLGRQQRFQSRKQKGSQNAEAQANKVARIQQRIARQRQDFHYREAHKIARQYDLIAVEDLNIRGLAKTRLAKSILDCGWGAFLNILEAVAVKCGNRFVRVSTYGTTVDCSGCGTKVPKTLSIRLHECPKCSLSMDRDENGALNVLHRGLRRERSAERLNAVGLTVTGCRGSGVTLPVKQQYPTSLLGSSLYSASST